MNATQNDAPAERLPRELWVLIAAALLIALGYGLVAPVLPRFAKSFDVGNAAAAFIVSIFAIFRLLFAPAGGAAIGRFGERPVYLVGILIVAVSTLATAFAGSYGQLLLFRGLGGIGSTMFTVSAMGLVVRLAPPSRRGFASSAYASTFLIGNITGPLLGGKLAGFGIQVPFLVYGVALVLAAALVFVALPARALRPAPGVTPLPPMALREALGDGAYRAALASSFANGWSAFGVRVALVPLFTAGVLHTTDSVTGDVLASFAAGNAVGIVVAGRLVDARGRKGLLLVGLAVAAVATAVSGWAGTALVLGAVSAVAGLGAGLLGPAQQASVADIIGRGRTGGQVLAAFQMSADLGAIVGPLVAGAIADRVGFGPAFLVSGLVLVAAFAVWLPQRDTARAVEGATAAAAAGARDDAR